MVLKAHLRNKFFVFITVLSTLSCSEPIDQMPKVVFEKIATAHIPQDTVLLGNQYLKLQNGIYYLSGKPFSGYMREQYPNNTLKSIGAYAQGKQHGTTFSFYENAALRDERNYKNGLSYGKHLGFWENGNKKFAFIYHNDKREGLQQQWYESGRPYYALNFANDREDGMQKAWRENGKPYINYEVKEGIRYGLQKAALCYTLKDGKLK
ncbi:MAG: hypothetical protein IT256_05795 [Chitinophagaceae bacterium]|nr:hypothetical protein [Chitinophagaceae bacterium]